MLSVDWLQAFVLSFVPLFVAIDAPGILPIYFGLTDSLADDQRKRLLRNACLTGGLIALVFMAGGQLLFRLMNITADDFRIAGGIILLIMATADLLFSHHEQRRRPTDDVGVVPIGTPLIIGPAALTTILMSVDAHGLLVTFLAIVLNLFIVWLLFQHASTILGWIGSSTAKAIAKIAALLLAAIAVMMIRVGVQNIVMAAGGK